jgi:hypothetical protein
LARVAVGRRLHVRLEYILLAVNMLGLDPRTDDGLSQGGYRGINTLSQPGGTSVG